MYVVICGACPQLVRPYMKLSADVRIRRLYFRRQILTSKIDPSPEGIKKCKLSLTHNIGLNGQICYSTRNIVTDNTIFIYERLHRSLLLHIMMCGFQWTLAITMGLQVYWDPRSPPCRAVVLFMRMAGIPHYENFVDLAKGNYSIQSEI